MVAFRLRGTSGRAKPCFALEARPLSFFTSPLLRLLKATAGQVGRYCHAGGVSGTIWYSDLKSAKPKVFQERTQARLHALTDVSGEETYRSQYQLIGEAAVELFFNGPGLSSTARQGLFRTTCKPCHEPLHCSPDPGRMFARPTAATSGDPRRTPPLHAGHAFRISELVVYFLSRSMNDTFSIAVVQHACSDNLDQNLASAISGVREAARRGARIISLQELFRSRYFCGMEDHSRFALAESAPGPTVEAIQAVARELDVVIVAPFFERRAAGVYHNSAAVIDADGSLLGTYRKMHIPDDPLYYEKFYFAPGDAAGDSKGFRVFQTKYATIGVLICWDQWYPEGARITALLGAEVLFYPTAIGWHPKEKDSFGKKQVSAWQTIQRSHAIANGVYVAAANRIGHEPTAGTDGIEFFGRSFICDPFGEIMAEASEDSAEVLVTTCSRTQIEATRQNWPFLRDRRIDAYSPILSRYLGKE